MAAGFWLSGRSHVVTPVTIPPHTQRARQSDGQAEATAAHSEGCVSQHQPHRNRIGDATRQRIVLGARECWGRADRRRDLHARGVLGKAQQRHNAVGILWCCIRHGDRVVPFLVDDPVSIGEGIRLIAAATIRSCTPPDT